MAASASKGLVVLLGAGPTSGVGICRHFAKQGYSVALLARTESRVLESAQSIRDEGYQAFGFASDTTSKSLRAAFDKIDQTKELKGLPLKVAIWHVKNALKKPFLETSEEEFQDSINTCFIVGSFNFAQTVLPRLKESKGTLIFTGTLGALRTNAQFAAYGAGRASVKMLAQAIGKEHLDVHVVHAIANGGIEDASGENQEKGTKMSAETVGKTYQWLAEQENDLWIDLGVGYAPFAGEVVDISEKQECQIAFQLAL